MNIKNKNACINKTVHINLKIKMHTWINEQKETVE